MSNEYFSFKRFTALFLAATLMHALAAGADEAGAIKKGIQSDDREERAKAFAAIEDLEPEARDKVVVHLAAEFRKWSRAFEDASTRIESLLKGHMKGLEKKEKLREQWEQAARESMAIIFDTAVFPDPPGPVSGPYIGYYEVMAEVDIARALYKKLRKEADRDLKKISGVKRENVERIRDEYLQSKARARELMDVLSRLGKKPEPLKEPPPFYRAMLFLKCEDWGIASQFFLEEGEELYMKEGKESGIDAAPGPPLSGYERALFFFLYARQVDAFNLRIDVPSTKNERAAVAKNNDYRISLGLCPLQIHPLITKAITDHLDTVKELSHTGATAETETPGDRIRLAGYKARGGAGENLAQSSLIQSMDGWKWDGGHHRVLVEPGAVHIGVYEKNDCGMNIATGELPELPVFDYLVHFK